MIYLFISLIASLVILGGLNVIQVILHYREKEEIFRKYMAGDYRLYQYFKKEYPVEVDNLEKNLEKKREEMLTPEQQKKKNIASQF